VQIALIAENEDLQRELATYGIETQVPGRWSRCKIHPSGELSAIYAQIGYERQAGPQRSPHPPPAQPHHLPVFRISRGNGGVFALVS
jgi:hypothetical protein